MFLRIRLPNEDMIWKPHYPESPAHMTLYDGENKRLSRLLYERMLVIFNFEAALKTSGVLKLQDELPLLPYHQALKELLGAFTQLGSEVEDLWSSNLTDDRRVELAAEAAQHLKFLFYEHGRVTKSQGSIGNPV